MSNRRFVLLISLMLAVMVGIILLSHTMNTESAKAKREGLFPNASIYSPKPSGYKAWYTVFKKAGIPIEPWRKGFRKLDEMPQPATMILIEPHHVSTDTFTFNDTIIEGVLGWVEAGNELVILDSFSRPSTQPFLKALNLRATEKVVNHAETTELEIPIHGTLLKSYLHEPLLTQSLYRFPKITSTTPLVLPLEAEQTEPFKMSSSSPQIDEEVGYTPDKATLIRQYHPVVLLQDAEAHPYLIQIQYGQGQIILGTPSDMASNHFLYNQNCDNYQFFANLLNEADGPLFVNEYVHGFGETPDLLTYYSKTPLGKIAVQLAFLFMFLLWASFYRWKPVLAPATGQGEGSSEKRFIESLAAIYERGQATSVVLAPMVKDLELTLRNRFRIELSETHRVEEALRTILRDNKEGTEPIKIQALKKAVETVQSEKRLSHRDTLMLMQQLSLIQEKLRYGSRTD